ncbi:MAG TPA: TolC family protein [Firmicutes bacterium]|nr:TolC family protein [Bacillota bacterium]
MTGYKRAALILALVFCLAVNATARQAETITWREALELAFERSPHFNFFLQEQRLGEARQKLAKHPEFKITAAPAEIKDGVWQPPRAVLSATMPLGDTLGLTGSLSIKSTPRLEAAPLGAVSLNYTPFKWQDPSGEEDGVQKVLLAEENELVLKTIDLLFQLRQKLAQEDFYREKYAYKEKYLAAAASIADFDSLQLKKELRELAARLADLKDEIDLGRLQLGLLLGTGDDVRFRPSLKVKPYQFDTDFDLYKNDYYSSHAALQTAREKMAAAKSRLAHEQKTGGWNVVVSGSAVLNDGWSVGIAASKTLYPRKIILEELKLAAARAEVAFLEQETAAANGLKAALKALDSAAEKIAVQAENVRQAAGDLEALQRRLQAGLTTEWAVREAKMQLSQTELEYESAQLAYVQKVLGFWSQCGVNLQKRIGELLE